MTRDPVAVRVPAGAEYVHILRTVARNVALDSGLPSPSVDDVASAIDEAATMLLDRRVVTGLSLRLEPGDQQVAVALKSQGCAGSEEWTEWRENTVTTRLSALADGVLLEVGDDGPCVRFLTRTTR